MKRIALILLATALFLASPSLALAQEGARYNFASVQGSKQISVQAGGEGQGAIYFYNIDGNRITHVTLQVSQAPDNWDVEIQPPTHEIQVNISGRIVTVTENLHVEPSEPLPEEVEDVPEGMACISVPSRGYVLAQPAYIIVQVPDSEEIGTKGDIRISAEAEWLGQAGAAAIKQARDFDFSVEVISGVTGFTETIIGEEEEVEKTKTPVPPAPVAPPTPTTPAEVEAKPTEPVPSPAGEITTPTSPIMDWLPAIIAGVVVILGAVIILRLVARKRG